MAGGDAGMEQMWPTPPRDCPPQTAQPWPGVFFRLVNDSTDDWRNHVQIYGPTWVAERARNEEELCCFNALSIFDDADAARQRLTYRKFASHRVVSFEMTDSMGKVEQTNGPHHYSWWPHGSAFQPPPPTVDVP